jgi:fatty acid elongase 3
VLDLGKQLYSKCRIVLMMAYLGFVYFASWDYFTSTYWPSLPHVGTCAGHPWAAIAGDTILSSYLVLFILFYLATYKSKSKGTKTHKKSASRAISDLKKTDVSNMANTVARAAEAIPKI